MDISSDNTLLVSGSADKNIKVGGDAGHGDDAVAPCCCRDTRLSVAGACVQVLVEFALRIVFSCGPAGTLCVRVCMCAHARVHRCAHFCLSCFRVYFSNSPVPQPCMHAMNATTTTTTAATPRVACLAPCALPSLPRFRRPYHTTLLLPSVNPRPHLFATPPPSPRSLSPAPCLPFRCGASISATATAACLPTRTP